MLFLSALWPLCPRLTAKGAGKRLAGPARGQSVSEVNSTAPEHPENLVKDNRNDPSLYTLSGNGIYVSGHINNQPTSILLDTGATTSVISEETWKKSGRYHPEKLEKVDATLEVANGEHLTVKGRINVNLRLGNLQLLFPVLVVKGISQCAILGCDFFKEYGCQSRYDVGSFVFRGEEIPIHYQKSPPRVCRIVASQNITLAPRTELMTEGSLESGYNKNFGSPGITEAICGRRNALDGVLVARGLVVPRHGKTAVATFGKHY